MTPVAATALARARTRARAPNFALLFGRSSSPGRVARLFVTGWLRCTYHQARCSPIAGTLRAYARVLAGQQQASLQTPSELAARPTILSLRLIHGCPASAIAIATYQDAEGGRFLLHVSLIDTPGAWRVFDVAEATPHIAPPKAMNHGPGKC